MRNPEKKFNRQTNRRDTDWESVGDDNPERLRDRRYEEMQKSEVARTSMINKVKGLAMAAVLAIAVAGGVAASGCSTHEIMDTDRAEAVTVVGDVKSVDVADGPYFRSNPEIPDKADGSNIIIDFGEEGQVAHVPYSGKVYLSPNGEWYGFPPEFVSALFDNAFISQKEAEQLIKKDKDGVIWINADYVRINKEEVTQD